MRNLSIVVVMLSGLCFASCGVKPQASSEMKEVADFAGWEYLPVGTILTLKESYQLNPTAGSVEVYHRYDAKGEIKIQLVFPPSDRERVLSAGTRFSLEATPEVSFHPYLRDKEFFQIVSARMVNSSKTFKVSMVSECSIDRVATIGVLAKAFDIQQPQPLVIGN